MKAAPLVVDIGPETLQISHGAIFVEFPLERVESGPLSEATRQRVIAALREHSQTNGDLFQARALCAVGARGISLRRLTLPAAAKEKLGDLIRLQVENEFPVPPEQLAWGWQIVGTSHGPAGKQHEILVAAIRRAALEEWAELFAAAGVAVSFTPAALARLGVVAAPAPDCALLDLGRRHSELLLIAKGSPAGIRALPWGADNLTGASLPCAPEQKLYWTGHGTAQPEVAARLAALSGAAPQALLPLAGAERSATIVGLQRLAGGEISPRPLLLQSGDAQNANGFRLPRQWTALAAALALAVICFPYLEPLLFKAHLTKRLNQIHAEETRLGTLDRELNFFQYLRKSQPPTLELFGLIARSAPPGTSFESYTLTRRGDLSLRGKMAGGTQVTDFRSKLMESGWFSTVVVDEQTAQPDRRVSVRLTAQLKPADARRPLPLAGESKPEKPART